MKSDLIIPVSKFSALKISADIDKNKIRIIPNGFDFDNLRDIIVEKKNIRKKTLTLISVGTVWPRKGHQNVLRVIPKLRELFPELTYNVVGRKADMSQVNEMLTQEVKDRVKFHGQVDNVTLQSLLNESDIFILLSETQKSGDFEGFGIAAIEANYFGLPAIGSKNSGLEDAINDGVSGILVDPKNDEEIVAAVKNISDDYVKFSNGAIDWANKHHWSKIVQNYIEAIRELSN
jgi:glycosyltransferase involved in cell wall biosynthesis